MDAFQSGADVLFVLLGAVMVLAMHSGFASQLVGTLLGIAVALAGGIIIYGLMKQIVGIRLSDEDEFQGADLSIHKIGANPPD